MEYVVPRPILDGLKGLKILPTNPLTEDPATILRQTVARVGIAAGAAMAISQGYSTYLVCVATAQISLPAAMIAAGGKIMYLGYTGFFAKGVTGVATKICAYVLPVIVGASITNINGSWFQNGLLGTKGSDMREGLTVAAVGTGALYALILGASPLKVALTVSLLSNRAFAACAIVATGCITATCIFLGSSAAMGSFIGLVLDNKADAVFLAYAAAKMLFAGGVAYLATKKMVNFVKDYTIDVRGGIAERVLVTTPNNAYIVSLTEFNWHRFIN